MAHSRCRGSHGAFALLLSLLQSHGVCSQDIFESRPPPESRALQATSTMPPRPASLSSCEDPVSGKGGYEPYCPPGYFRCCASCKGAVCFSTKGLHLSWRGIRECIKCKPGDYCTGCDTYLKCRPSVISGREGPKISPHGSTRRQDCETCPAGYEANVDRSRCVKKWTDVCNSKWVSRCIRNCRSPVVTRRKDLNFCEKMQCEMYCAKRWGNGCAQAFGKECEYRKAGPSEYDLYSETEEWLMDCNVDCNGSLSSSRLSFLMLALCMVVAFVF